MFYWNKKPRVFSSDIILTELFLCLYIRANGGWGSCWFVEVIWRVLGSLWHSVSWFPVGFFAGTRRVSLPWETSRGQDGSVMCVLSLRKTPLTWSLQRPQTIDVYVQEKYYTSEWTECGERPHKTVEKDRSIHTSTLLLQSTRTRRLLSTVVPRWL